MIPSRLGEGRTNNHDNDKDVAAAAVAAVASSSSPSSWSSSQTPPSSSTTSAIAITTISRECAKCLSYLTRALDGGSGSGGGDGIMKSTSAETPSLVLSRPAILLRALGVAAPMDRNGNDNASSSNDDDSRKCTSLYQMMPNGRGVMIQLENKGNGNNNSIIHNNCNTKKNSDNDEGRLNFDNHHTMNRQECSKGGERETGGENSQQQHQQHLHYPQQQHKPNLERLISKNATPSSSSSSPLNNSIQNIIIDHNTSDVLTTSPLPTTSSLEHSSQSTKKEEENDALPRTITITIECTPCGSESRAEACARAYVRGPDPLGIVLCSNRLSSSREVEEVLVHELVHIYDVHIGQMDLRDCKQLAYSEVRAAREAECGNRMTSFTTNICAKDRAIVATRNMFPDEGKKCVCDVFDAAMKDNAPFSFSGTSKSSEGRGGATIESGELFGIGLNRRRSGKIPSNSTTSGTFESSNPSSSTMPPRRSDR